MNILGISAYYHDSAAALVQDGRLIAAAQEERFTRKKADWAFPEHAIRYCLSHLPDPGTEFTVAFYENPTLKLERVLQHARRTAPRGAALWPHTLRMMREYGKCAGTIVLKTGRHEVRQCVRLGQGRCRGTEADQQL